MTQAFNLSQFANKLNSSGQTDNTGLQNSAVTVTAGTGMSGGGSVALGSSVTLTNAGVTSVTAGTGISLSGSTGAVTITNTSSASGTVTSVATGNGLSGGTITSSGTLVIACPSANSVGSYAFCRLAVGGSSIGGGSTVSASNIRWTNVTTDAGNILSDSGTPSGTWRNMLNGTWEYGCATVACRVS